MYSSCIFLVFLIITERTLFIINSVIRTFKKGRCHEEKTSNGFIYAVFIVRLGIRDRTEGSGGRHHVALCGFQLFGPMGGVGAYNWSWMTRVNGGGDDYGADSYYGGDALPIQSTTSVNFIFGRSFEI